MDETTFVRLEVEALLPDFDDDDGEQRVNKLKNRFKDVLVIEYDALEVDVQETTE